MDDEAAVLRVLVRGLSRAGFQVSQASNGLEALELLKQTEFDLVVTDILMPILNGWQVLEEIRMQKPHLPVVLISGYDPNPRPLQGQETFLAKPFSIQRLVDLANQFLTHEQCPNSRGSH